MGKKKSWENFQLWVAERVKGRETPGSGNTDFKKLDVETDFLLIECKDTRDGSYRITKKEFNEYLQAAAMEGKMMVLTIRIQDKVIACFDFEDALALLEVSEEKERDGET